MRFAIIGNAASTLVNFRANLIGEIVSRGHVVFALAPDFTVDACNAISKLGAVPIHFPLARTGLDPVIDLVNAWRLRYILTSLGLDAVLSYGIKPAIFGTLSAKYAGIRLRYVLITGLGYAFTDGGVTSLKRLLVGKAARALYHIALRHADTVLMQNPDDAADFVRIGIVPANKIVTVNGTGVDLNEWQPAAPVTNPVTFLLAARMLRDKGVLEFVQAARLVKGRYPNARFVLAGDIDTNPEAISVTQLSEWVNEGIVEWPGHVGIKEWLTKTSVFVLPSYREGVPRSTQEAMAMGRPVITTDVPGCRETVIDGRNGFLVPVRDTEALADTMKLFIERPSLIEQMGAASRSIAVDKFDVKRVNTRMITAMGL